MAIHLFAVGKPPAHDEPDLDYVWSLVRKGGRLVCLDRCSSPLELVERATSAVVEAKMFAHTLDIYDHGTDGFIQMGDDPLFQVDASGGLDLASIENAQRLGDLLIPGGRIRLLGCNVGVSDEGRALLLGLRAALRDKGILVQATIARTNANHFGPGGFLPALEDLYLFSSVEAEEGRAPDFRARVEAIIAHLDELRNAPLATPART